MDKIKRGEEITKAIYKAALKAVFEIGVRSPHYIEQYTTKFSEALDQEFIKIGLFQPQQTEDSSPLEVLPPSTSQVEHNIDEEIGSLKLRPLTKHALAKQGITTIGKLMEEMQKDSLTGIKGISVTRATEILTAFSLWNSQV